GGRSAVPVGPACAGPVCDRPGPGDADADTGADGVSLPATREPPDAGPPVIAAAATQATTTSAAAVPRPASNWPRRERCAAIGPSRVAAATAGSGSGAGPGQSALGRAPRMRSLGTGASGSQPMRRTGAGIGAVCPADRGQKL